MFCVSYILALLYILFRLKDMSGQYIYDGQDTCAADGMCQEKCPVKINTGDLIKHIRSEEVRMSGARSNGFAR